MKPAGRRTLPPATGAQESAPDPTLELASRPGGPISVRSFSLSVLEGDARGLEWTSSGDRCSIGSHPSNDLVLSDPTVSRFHTEIEIEKRGARLRDLESLNGTWLDGVRVVDAYLEPGSRIRLGRTLLGFAIDAAARTNELPVSERDSFGALIGKSLAMRRAFAVLERVAKSDATVLIEGETGTGKEAAAEGIHQQSARREGGLVVVDCGAVPANLLESQLFGHERGAFTGAAERRLGAFEEAEGGSVFLDEIGELPLELQPKLLRVLERRQIQRLGSNQTRDVDVRILAATNRDLRAMVNAGELREDLYYRLAVVHVRLPALRERPEDIPALVRHFLDSFGATPEAAARLTADEHLGNLARSAWPGNVRELRNAIQRSLVLDQPIALSGAESAAPRARAVDISVPYDEARRRALLEFEREYLALHLSQHDGNVSKAAKAAGVGRVHMHRLLRRAGLR
jgi:DNA-binding NtrC family response regulator